MAILLSASELEHRFSSRPLFQGVNFTIADGDRVCIASRTRPEWVIADLASLSLGAVTCPIYPQSEPGQAAFVINNVGARLAFVENAQQANKIDSIRDQCPTLKTIVSMEASGKLPDGALTLEDVIARGADDADSRRLWREGWRALRRDHP